MKVRRISLVVVVSFALSLVACGGGEGPSNGDPTPPAAPSNVTVVPGPGSVSVSWQHDGVGVTGFVIYREAVTAAAAQVVQIATEVGQVGASERSFVDDTVAADQAYRYSVAARGSGGVTSAPTDQAGAPVVPEPEDSGSLEFALAWEAFVARGEVRSMAFSPDGARLATGILDAVAYVWDIESGDQVLALSVGSTVSAVGFTPDGKILATGGYRLMLWEAGDGSQVLRIDLNVGPDALREWVNDLAFSPDGTSVAIASDSGFVRVYSVATGEPLLAIDVSAGTEGSSVSSAQVAEAPRYVVTEDAAGAWRMSDARIGLAEVHASATTRALSVAFSPDGRQLVSGSTDGGVRVWDATTGALARSFEGFRFNANAVSFSPDGATIAAAGTGGLNAVIMWNASSGEVERRLDALGDGVVLDVAFAPAGGALAGAGGDGLGYVWNVASGDMILTWEAHVSAANAVAYAPTGTHIATVGGRKDGRAIVWEAETAEEVVTWQHEGHVRDVTFSPDGSQVVAGAADGKLIAWEAGSGVESFVNDEASRADRIRFSPDGERIAVADYYHVNILDSETGASLLRIRTPDWVFSLAFDTEGKRIASGLWDRSIHVWDAASGEATLTIDDAHARGQLETLAYAPNDVFLVSGIGYVRDEAEFAVWDSTSGVEVERLEANAHGVFAVAFADEGRLMLTGGRSSIMLWDTTSWENVGQLPITGTAAVLVVADDVVVVSGWGMTSVLFLDRESGDQLGALPVSTWHIDYHAPSGRLVLAAGATVQVWEVSEP